MTRGSLSASSGAVSLKTIVEALWYAVPSNVDRMYSFRSDVTAACNIHIIMPLYLQHQAATGRNESRAGACDRPDLLPPRQRDSSSCATASPETGANGATGSNPTNGRRRQRRASPATTPGR